MPVRLSKARIQDSPPVATESTVSRHQEERLRAHYGWPNWWSTPLQGVTIPTSRELGDTKAREAALGVQEVEPHLRSANEILGYHIEAIGGDVGHVEDLIVDDDVWAIRYFVVDTKNILPGKKVIVSPHWVTEARWHDSKVAVALQKKQIEEAPKFDPHEPINRRYEERLYDFYGRPRYW